MKASDAFRQIPLTPEEQEDEEAEKLAAERKFPWHTKYGIRKNVKQLNKEFNEFRGLNPVKIFITGPPASGKTFYADQLAKYYNIPKVNVRQLVDKVFEMADIDEETAGENQLINDCRTKIDEIKAKMEEDIVEAREGLDPPDEDGWPDPEIKREDIRVPNDLLYRVLKLKLAENDCRNRGYILDGFPRIYKDAQNIFLYKPIKYDENGEPIEDEDDEPDGDEDAEPTFKGFEKDASIFPSSCIVLEGDDEDLIERVKNQEEARLEGTHYNLESMQRRLEQYRLANNSEVAEPSVQDFFR